MEKTTMSDFAIPDFFKAQFINVPESYGIDEPVSVRYLLTDSQIQTDKDWIGLYRVGWKFVEDYVISKHVNISNDYEPGREMEYVCTFTDNLPKDGDDFFQFCYVDCNNRVCGASSPFQFIDDFDIINETDCVESEQLQCNGTSLKEMTQQSSSRVEELTTELEETRKLSQKKDLKLNSLISEIDQLKMKLNQNEMILSEFSDKEMAYQEKQRQLNATVADVQQQLCHKAQELEVIKMDHATNMGNLDVKEKAVNDLTKRCNKLTDENSMMKRKMDHMSSRYDADWKQKETEYENRIRILETDLDDEKLKTQKLQEMLNSVRRRERDNVTVTDGPNETTATSLPTPHHDDNDNNTNSSIPDRSFENGGASMPSTCDFCQVTFPPHVDGQVIYDHWLKHDRCCPICNEQFDPRVDQHLYEEHVAEHLATTRNHPDWCCPICNEQFDPHVDQHLYEAHVAEHLATTRNYPDWERICPVCSNDLSHLGQALFEAHVRDHFGE